MIRVLILVAGLVACSKPPPTSSSGAPTTNATNDRFAVTATRVGPIDANTRATQDGLRAALPGFQVKEAYAFDMSAAEAKERGVKPDFQVLAEDELLYTVATVKDAPSYIRIVSPRMVSDAGWHVGGTFTNPEKVTTCKCIGYGLLCFAKGAHVGVGLDEDCARKLETGSPADRKRDGERYDRLLAGDRASLDALRGSKIRFLEWRIVGLDENLPTDPDDGELPPPEEEDEP